MDKQPLEILRARLLKQLAKFDNLSEKFADLAEASAKHLGLEFGEFLHKHEPSYEWDAAIEYGWLVHGLTISIEILDNLVKELEAE